MVSLNWSYVRGIWSYLSRRTICPRLQVKGRSMWPCRNEINNGGAKLPLCQFRYGTSLAMERLSTSLPVFETLLFVEHSYPFHEPSHSNGCKGFTCRFLKIGMKVVELAIWHHEDLWCVYTFQEAIMRIHIWCSHWTQRDRSVPKNSKN